MPKTVEYKRKPLEPRTGWYKFPGLWFPPKLFDYVCGRERQISTSEVGLLLIVATAVDEDGWCDMTLPELGEQLNRHHMAVGYSVKKLSEQGLLIREGMTCTRRLRVAPWILKGGRRG